MNEPCDRDQRRRNSLQFGTRALLAAITCCAVLVLIFQRLGPVWGTSILWFLILAGAHVAANAFGTRQTAAAQHARASPAADDARISFAPATPLRYQRGFGRRLIVVTTLSALIGLLSGIAALVLVVPANLAGVALGSISSGILGGILGFVGGSFVMVATRSFREAVEQESVAAGGTTARSL